MAPECASYTSGLFRHRGNSCVALGQLVHLNRVSGTKNVIILQKTSLESELGSVFLPHAIVTLSLDSIKKTSEGVTLCLRKTGLKFGKQLIN